MKRALLLALLTVALTAAPVVAAPAVSEWQQVDVTLHEEQGNSVLIVSGMLPDGARLPAQVALTAPKGSELKWAGEITGGGADSDIETTPQKSEGQEFDTYTFTLTKTPVGQIEVVPPAPATTSSDGQTFATAFVWTPSTDVETVRVNALVPAGAKLTNEVEGAELVPGGDASTAYLSKTFTKVKADEPLEFAFNYTVPAAAAAAVPPASSPSSPALVVVLVGAGVLLVGAFIAIRRKTRLSSTEEALDDEDAGAQQAVLAFEASGDAEDVVGAGSAGGDQLHTDGEPVLPRPRSRAPLAIVFGVVGVIMVFVVVAGYRSSTPLIVDGAISRTFGTGDACTQASIAVRPVDGVDLARSANDVLEVFAAVPVVTTASLYVDEGRVEVGYCDSSANEDVLKQALASTGLVAVD